MDLGGFFQRYFLDPVIERTGYNAVNTTVYAVVALTAAYAIFKAFRRFGVKVDAGFAYSVLAFVLFGSSLRVVVDANILPYSYLTTTPGIYVLVGFITLASVAALHFTGRMRLLGWVGAMLSIPALLLLLPIFKYYFFAALIAALACCGAAAGALLLRLARVELSPLAVLAVFAHALDGAATFVSIDVFPRLAPAGAGVSYFEQHVVTNGIAQAFGGFWAFYVIKVAFAAGAVYFLGRTAGVTEEERSYVLLLVIIFGLAPGIRDLLRLLCGV